MTQTELSEPVESNNSPALEMDQHVEQQTPTVHSETQAETTTEQAKDGENDVISSSITVAVRVRPLTEKEKCQLPSEGNQFAFNSGAALANSDANKFGGARKVISVLDDKVLVFDPPPGINGINGGTNARINHLRGGRPNKDVRFAFDRVFGEDATQEEVFCGTTKKLVGSVLNGYNATVFAYGATGCGKTHTISGTPSDPGIIFLTMRELFERIRDNEDEMTTEISISYLEVYNETIRDLLVPEGTRSPPLALREDQRGVMVAGLSEHHPQTPDDVMKLILLGNKNRTMSPTCANAVSSRSHAVLQVNVRRRPRTASIDTQVTVATMSIIDLAGSERASVTKNTGERLLEGANINRSLLALGNCINALCDPKRSGHIPYRDSKLTRLLKFSLGGNCQTVMIVCVSPFSAHYEETHNTLKYANRAKNIKTNAARNTVNVTMHVSQYRRIIAELKGEITELKRKLRVLRTSGDKGSRTGTSSTNNNTTTTNTSDHLSPACQSLVDKELERMVRLYTVSRANEQAFAEYAFTEEACQSQSRVMRAWYSAFEATMAENPESAAATESFRRTAQQAIEEAESKAREAAQKRAKIDELLEQRHATANQMITGCGGIPTSRRRERELAQREFKREHERLELLAANARLERALAASQQQLMRVTECLSSFAQSSAHALAGLRSCVRLVESLGPDATPQLNCLNAVYMQSIQAFSNLAQLVRTGAEDSLKGTSTQETTSSTTDKNSTGSTQGQLDRSTVARILEQIRAPHHSNADTSVTTSRLGAPQRTPIASRRIVSSPIHRRRPTPIKPSILTGARRLLTTAARRLSPVQATSTAQRAQQNSSKLPKGTSPAPIRSSLRDPNRPRRVNKTVVVISPRSEALLAKRAASTAALDESSSCEAETENTKAVLPAAKRTRISSPTQHQDASISDTSSTQQKASTDTKLPLPSTEATTTTTKQPTSPRRLSNESYSGPLRDYTLRRRERAMRASLGPGVLARLDRRQLGVERGDLSLLSGTQQRKTTANNASSSANAGDTSILSSRPTVATRLTELRALRERLNAQRATASKSTTTSDKTALPPLKSRQKTASTKDGSDHSDQSFNGGAGLRPSKRQNVLEKPAERRPAWR